MSVAIKVELRKSTAVQKKGLTKGTDEKTADGGKIFYIFDPPNQPPAVLLSVRVKRSLRRKYWGRDVVRTSKCTQIKPTESYV